MKGMETMKWRHSIEFGYLLVLCMCQALWQTWGGDSKEDTRVCPHIIYSLVEKREPGKEKIWEIKFLSSNTLGVEESELSNDGAGDEKCSCSQHLLSSYSVPGTVLSSLHN